jgi:glycosyltransferase involved in cell wall biosynthesis
MLRIVVVTNEPPPYRVPIFNRIARVPGIVFQVIFCCRREPNRLWNLPPMEFDHVFLRERITTVKGRYIHNNPDVLKRLNEFKPDVIVTDGFNPTYLYSFAYAWLKGIVHVPLTDGTYDSEKHFSAIHKTIRRFVYKRSATFLSASAGGQRLYESYGISPDLCYRSYLCIENEAFTPIDLDAPKDYDFIFCGRMEPGKSPLFAVNVAAEVARRLDRKVKILFVGSGSQDEEVKEAARRQADSIDAHFHGFATQEELPGLYRSARIFLFPTLADVWGVVANEACAAGLPVLITPHAGVVGELVVDDKNGFVCDLDVNLWAERSIQLLTNPDLYRTFAERSLSLVSHYTFDNAAKGLLDACRAGISAAAPGGQRINSTS